MTFKVGQKVVYPNHGVTVVDDIATSFIDGAERTCYHLRLLSSNSKVMVPKDNLDLVGLRPLCEVKEIRNVLGILENGSFDATFSSLSGRPGRQIFDWSTASGTVSVGRTVALAGDGRIVVAGGAERAPGDMDFVAARLRNDYIFADSFDWGGFGHWSSHTD